MADLTKVSCLRCGASRSSAAVVAEGTLPNHGGNNYNGPPPQQAPSMGMPPMDGASYGGMTPNASNYGGSQMGGPPGAFGGQQYGPPSTYALPSGFNASPYMGGGYMANNGAGPGAGGFDSRAEQAFNQGNTSATGGAQGFSNGGYGPGNSAGGYGNDTGDVSLSFLTSGMGNLGFGDRDDRRNGQGGAKSPQ